MPIAQETLQLRDAARRQALIDAARACFLQFGFDKTSLGDVAERAEIARPLVYKKYKSKQELLTAVHEADAARRSAEIDQVSAGRASKREKLLRLAELFFIEPWGEIAAAPMAGEFHDGARLDPEVAAKHEKLRLKHVQAVLGSKELAEVFLLAARGLQSDRAAPKVLKRRFEVLVEKFAGA